MNIEKIKEIVGKTSEHSNKELLESANFLYLEFENTKKLIIDLTKHLDIVEELHTKVSNELKIRNIPEDE